MLTKSKIDAAKPREKPYKLFDGRRACTSALIRMVATGGVSSTVSAAQRRRLRLAYTQTFVCLPPEKNTTMPGGLLRKRASIRQPNARQQKPLAQ